ncbi:VOC family protein [Phenylobacterium sp.]|uniref:VOC family protein n=1 Tax=Phenylobacterium sp. TaxID=1871053 RepID=UPI00301D052A
MAAALRHFAINADDPPRARRFYEEVFGWTFRPWGPPGFHQTSDAGDGVIGALQGRREVAGRRMPGMEITFAVEDIDATVAAIAAAGGRPLSQPFHIESVGRLVWFEDSEGNVAGAMQYEARP